MVSNIIVIGGGIVGASFAYHANLKKIEKISVISDALPGDVQQATSNTWGWINGYANNDSEYASLRLASLNYWSELIKNQALSYTSKGAFFWDLKEPELNQIITQHQSWGHAVDIKDQSYLKRLLPNLLDIPNNAGYGKNDMAIEASQITHQLIKISQAKIIKERVTKLLFDQNVVKGVQIGKEKIYADEIVIASGLGTPDLLKSIDIDFTMKSTLGLLAYTNPLPPVLKYPITGIDFHARQDENGRLIIGGRFDDDASKENRIEEVAKKLVSDMSIRLKYKGEMKLEHYTLGKRPLTNDGRPKIGRLKNSIGEIIKGVYIAVMHSGITNAPIVGKLGVEEIISEKQDSLLHSFSPQQTNK